MHPLASITRACTSGVNCSTWNLSGFLDCFDFLGLGTKAIETRAMVSVSRCFYTPVRSKLMAREFVRMWSNSFFVRPSFEIQVHLRMLFLRNQDPRAARPCDEQNDSIRSELSLSAPEPYLPTTPWKSVWSVPVVELRSPRMNSSSCGGTADTAEQSCS